MRHQPPLDQIRIAPRAWQRIFTPILSPAHAALDSPLLSPLCGFGLPGESAPHVALRLFLCVSGAKVSSADPASRDGAVPALGQSLSRSPAARCSSKNPRRLRVSLQEGGSLFRVTLYGGSFSFSTGRTCPDSAAAFAVIVPVFEPRLPPQLYSATRVKTSKEAELSPFASFKAQSVSRTYTGGGPNPPPFLPPPGGFSEPSASNRIPISALASARLNCNPVNR